MNKELFELARQGIKRRRKSSLLLLTVLTLSFAFAVITVSVSGSMLKTNEEYRKDAYGEWRGAIVNAALADEEFLRSRADISKVGSSETYGMVTGDKTSFSIGVLSDGLVSIGRIKMQDGRLPEAENEVAMEANKLSALGYDYALGQVIEMDIAVPTGGKTPPVTVRRAYTLCGVIKGYTDLWSITLMSTPLNAAVFTEEAAASLTAEAEAEAERISSEAGEQIDELKQKNEEPDQSLLALKDITVSLPKRSLFFTMPEDRVDEVKEAVDAYLDGRRSVVMNKAAYEPLEEASVSRLYTVMIFIVTVFGILCIYAIQLQKQVRQLALFRSIGIRKNQLRTLVLYETLLLCIPAAAAGLITGAAGTWAVLRLAVYSGSAPIRVSVPWLSLGLLCAAWAAGVFAARLTVMQIAFKTPLTGRVAAGGRQTRRYAALRRTMVGLLSVLLCGSLVFVTLEALSPYKMLQLFNGNFSYQVTVDRIFGSGIKSMISQEEIARIEALPGVTGMDKSCNMFAELRFDGMDGILMYNEAREALAIETRFFNSPNTGFSPNALSVNLHAVKDEELFKGFDVDELGLDIDAFHRGEQVISAFRHDIGGEYMMYYPLYDTAESNVGISSEARHYDETGIKTGDVIDLTVFGRKDQTGNEDITPLWNFRPAAVVADISYGDSVWADAYDVYCSYDYLERAFYQMPEGYRNYYYHTGEDFGYYDLLIYCDDTAGYLSTDTVMAELCREYGRRFNNNREFNSARRQEYSQTLILLLSVGGCIALVTLLLLGNVLVMETEREKRSFGVKRLLGLSKKSLRRTLIGRGLLRGAAASLSGWAVYGVWLLIKSKLALIAEGERELWQQTFFDYPSALEHTVHSLRADGLDLRLMLTLTLTAAAITAILSVITKRGLFKDELIEHLNDE